MNDLRVWLLERLVEREALASAATPGPWEHIDSIGWEVPDDPCAHEVVTSQDCSLGITLTGPYGDRQSRVDARYIAANDPSTTLRRVRAQIAMLTPFRRVEHDVMRLMALEFSDHPEYLPEWSPVNVGMASLS